MYKGEGEAGKDVDKIEDNNDAPLSSQVISVSEVLIAIWKDV